MKVGEQILMAARKQAEGELEVHKTNIAVYQSIAAKGFQFGITNL